LIIEYWNAGIEVWMVEPLREGWLDEPELSDD